VSEFLPDQFGNTTSEYLKKPESLPGKLDDKERAQWLRYNASVTELSPEFKSWIKNFVLVEIAGDLPGAGSSASTDGWTAATGETWTYASADSPTFTFTVATDLTTKYAAGQRIKLTQTTAKYFIVTKVSYSAPNTTVTIYGGTDYTLANAAITLPYMSREKAPFGFNLDPTKWTAETTSTAHDNQGATVAGTWYNLGSRSLSVPIGVWELYYEACSYIDTDDDVNPSKYTTLSTANNTESDISMTCLSQINGGGAGVLDQQYENHIRRRTLVLTTKQSYFLNSKTSNGGSTIGQRGDIGTTVIRAICAYL